MSALTYKQSGVDIERAGRLLARLTPLIRATHGPEVMPDRGQFAGLFRLPAGRFREPVLVSSTDGVGTKLTVARLANAHRAIGIDVVAMNTNDVLVYGARPLFFLDYIAMGRLSSSIYRQLLEGIAAGCTQSGCALVGGETAEMPGVYGAHEYDVAGFCVGAVERSRLIDGAQVRAGDALVWLASSGVHANGFSLMRKALGPAGLKRWKRQLLIPTRIYVKPILLALRRVQVSAIAHITGGGLARRIPSVVAKQPGLRAVWQPGRWPVPRLFRVIQEAGRISEEDMYATLNMGIGMVVACRPRDVARLRYIVERARIQTWVIGMVERTRG